ncbi:MAG: FAD-dependent oxidoreductase [Clostridia bacterium]|nr:FAD-dependent oxidoreductase [Clostridia bacterium]
MNGSMKWPYPSRVDDVTRLQADVVVLGGGIAGCMAAIAAAKKGRSVILVEKGATKRSGAGGSGCDHWESAATNPCSGVTPEELVKAMLDDNDGFNNGISHYIECREGWDHLQEIEKMGGKIRDTEDEFKGAEFRDEKTKLMFAYDYKNKFTIRIWGTTFKPAMEKELKRLGVKIVDRVMVTSLLTENGKVGGKCIGATGVHTRTGEFYVFSGKAMIIAMSRPARVWLFSSAHPGLCEFRPLQTIGDGHAMGWRIGAEFNMMEKSVRAEFSAAGRSFPPYSAGNNHNTWYPASMVDAEGREIPYADRDGNILKTVSERFRPAKGQSYFLKGGNIEQAKYEYDGPETLPYEKLSKMGYKLPFYTDLSIMPELERKVIWGMMVGQEGKTNVPVYRNFTEQGFDPEKDVLQCYGTGWTSAEFLPQERQLFGMPGGFMNDWDLMTNIPGLFVAGDSLFSSNCFGHAASTGSYAGRKAAAYASREESFKEIAEAQAEAEMKRIYAPLYGDPVNGISWKELNEAIAKGMQNYCGEQKRDELLLSGLELMEHYEKDIVPHAYAANPHELMRLLEVFDILTVAKIILNACLARRQSCEKLEFFRLDDDGGEPKPFICISTDGKKIITREVPLDYAGDIKENYEKYNADYIEEKRKEAEA